MGRSESDWNSCRKHPKHKNSTGVCPYCLKERLVHLSSPSFSFFNLAVCSTSASSTPFYSSDSDLSSLAESPTHEKIRNATIGLLLKDEKLLGDALPMKRSEPLLKSRSMIHVVGRKNELEDEDRRKLRLERGKKEKVEEVKDAKKEKKARFWSKILKAGLRKNQKGEKSLVLGHSRTLKETTSAKWVPTA